MNASELLASSLHKKDDTPNIELALNIIQSNNTVWILELVAKLQDKRQTIQSDCIKVLYEIGEHKRGELIAPHCKAFLQLLSSKNNRMVWGAMKALDTIASHDPFAVYKGINDILQAMETGSVITVDHGIGVMAKLAAIPSLSDIVFYHLIKQLMICPAKQLPQYAEKSLSAVNKNNREQMIALLLSRLRDMEKDSQRIRIQKVLRKIEQIQ